MLKDEPVENEAHRALDGVFEGDEAEVDVTGLGCLQHVAHRAHGDKLSVGEIGLAEESLFCERAGGSEKRDAGRHGAEDRSRRHGLPGQ